MGYTIILQWTYTSSDRTAPLSEYITNRILEHYNLSQSIRTTAQFRSFRATFPGPSQRILTSVVYSKSIPPMRDGGGMTARDDTTYLVIEDRPVGQDGAGTSSMELAKSVVKVDGAATSTRIEDDGFELIDLPPASKTADLSLAQPNNPPSLRQRRFQTLAVRPASSAQTLLTNLLSPFVLGYTKAARAAASTTAEIARPTILPGSTMILTSTSFPIPLSPHPPVSLTIHNLPTATAASIFLEVDIDCQDAETREEKLRNFLSGCLPEGGLGETKIITWDQEDNNWEGVERMRKVSQMLVRTLREGGFA